MSQSQNIAGIVQKTIENLFNTGDLSVLDEHPGMLSLRRVFPAFKTAFPDVQVELQQQVVQDNRVASHWIFRGTHLGDLYGIPPTGKPVHFQNISIVRIQDGKIVQYNSEIGWLSIFMEIGVLPAHNGQVLAKMAH
jgi:hypothetical protein